MSTYKERVQAAMAVIDSDFAPLQALLAEDAIFKATVPPGTPISGEFSGREAIADYFNRVLPEVAIFEQQVAPELIAEGNRVIVLGDDAYTLKKNGKTYRSPYAMVITFDGELARSIVIIQDLSGIAEAYH